ncbi:MAG: histidine phosphatase family protein, partial [Actinomycetota bacterium]
TAEEIAAEWEVPLLADERLREAMRPWIGPGYRAVVHRYLRGELPEGWEPHGDVARRVGAAVREAADRAGERTLVVVSHGLSLALHLGERLGPEFDRESFWSSLAFPDAWVLDEQGFLHRCDRAPHL